MIQRAAFLRAGLLALFLASSVIAQDRDDYYLEHINMPSVTPDTSNVVLVVIGRGVRPTPNLNFWQNPIDGSHGKNFIDYGDDTNEFGDLRTSIVAEVAGGLGVAPNSVRGVTPGLQIYPIKVNGNTDGDFIVITRVIAAIRYLVELSAQSQFYGVRLIVLVDMATPFGLPEFEAAFKLLENAHVPVVASVGNQDINVSNIGFARYPAVFPFDNIVPVSGTDRSRRKLFGANIGPDVVHVSAPAILFRNGITYDGTGIAAGMVAAALAIVYSNPAIDDLTAIAHITDPASVQPLQDAGIGGLLDVKKALSSNALPNLHPTLVFTHPVDATVDRNFIVDASASQDPEDRELTFTVVTDDGVDIAFQSFDKNVFKLVFAKAFTSYFVGIDVSDGFHKSSHQIFYVPVFPYPNRPPSANIQPQVDFIRYNVGELHFDLSGSSDPERKPLKFFYYSVDHPELGLSKPKASKSPHITIRLPERPKLGSYTFAFLARERKGHKQFSITRNAIRFVTDVITLVSVKYDEQTQKFTLIAKSSHQHDSTLKLPVHLQVAGYGPMRFDAKLDAFVFESFSMPRPTEPILIFSNYQDQISVILVP